MKLDKNYFSGQKFTDDTLKKYREAIARCIGIASKNEEPEVKFDFTYKALLKIGLYCIAKAGYRVKSRPGHHQKILETLSKILNSDDIMTLGDKMRKDRNLDLYSSERVITQKEANEYFNFVENVIKKI